MDLTGTPDWLRKTRANWPRCPPDIAEEVELYARESGRTATVMFLGPGGWAVRFSLRCNDKRLLAYQEGRAAAPPTEDVFFHVHINHYDPRQHKALNGHAPERGKRRASPYIPLDIHSMGVSGVRSFLERGNMWSGRGDFSSPKEAMSAAMESNDKMRQSRREDAKDGARGLWAERRRKILGIPFVSVLSNLGKK